MDSTSGKSQPEASVPDPAEAILCWVQILAVSSYYRTCVGATCSIFAGSPSADWRPRASPCKRSISSVSRSTRSWPIERPRSASSAW